MVGNGYEPLPLRPVYALRPAIEGKLRRILDVELDFLGGPIPTQERSNTQSPVNPGITPAVVTKFPSNGDKIRSGHVYLDWRTVMNNWGPHPKNLRLGGRV